MAGILREDAERWLGQVPEGKVFWCCDSRMLRTMADLEDALRTISDETFAYHSSEEKNDFSSWVEEVIGDAKLARDLRKATSRPVAARRVAERVAFLFDRLV